MNPLQLRKQLLIAESELNRAQLVQEFEALAEGVHSVASRAKSFTEIASSAAVLVAALAAFRQAKPAPSAVKPSWLGTILKTARFVFTCWRTFRSTSRDQH
jgi:hypothetical protein